MSVLIGGPWLYAAAVARTRAEEAAMRFEECGVTFKQTGPGRFEGSWGGFDVEVRKSVSVGLWGFTVAEVGSVRCMGGSVHASSDRAAYAALAYCGHPFCLPVHDPVGPVAVRPARRPL